MTPSSRLRSLLSRLVGERVMLAVARWAVSGTGSEVLHSAMLAALCDGWESAATERDEERRKRRALARRRLARRAERLRLAAAAKAVIYEALAAPEPTWMRWPGTVVTTGPLGASVGLGEAVYRTADGRWFPANRERVVQPGGQYAPSGACEIAP